MARWVESKEFGTAEIVHISIQPVGQPGEGMWSYATVITQAGTFATVILDGKPATFEPPMGPPR